MSQRDISPQIIYGTILGLRDEKIDMNLCPHFEQSYPNEESVTTRGKWS